MNDTDKIHVAHAVVRDIVDAQWSIQYDKINNRYLFWKDEPGSGFNTVGADEFDAALKCAREHPSGTHPFESFDAAATSVFRRQADIGREVASRE